MLFFELRSFQSFKSWTSVVNIAESIRLHNLRNAQTVLRTHVPVSDLYKPPTVMTPTVSTTVKSFFHTAANTVTSTLSSLATTLPTTTSTRRKSESLSSFCKLILLIA